MRAGTVKQCLFGAALVNIRESLQISQYQLAKRTGIAEEYLNKLENSKREPKARMIIRLGRGLGVSPGDLLNQTFSADFARPCAGHGAGNFGE